MHLKHSFSILISNLSLIYKLLIFMAIILLIVAAVLVSILNPVVKTVNETLEIEGHSFSLRELLRDPGAVLGNLWDVASDYFSANVGQIALRVFYMFLVLVFVRFMISTVMVAIGKILYERMTSGSKLNLFPSFVAALPKSLPYALLSAVIFSLIDFGIVVFCIWMMLKVFSAIRIASLLLFSALMFVLLSARLCLFSQWIPRLCDSNERFFVIFKKSIKAGAKSFFTMLPAYFTVTIIAFTILVTTLISTFGVFPVIMLPALSITYMALGMVGYFNSNKKKYYIDNGETVYAPPPYETTE